MEIRYLVDEQLRELGFGFVGKNVRVAENCHIPNRQSIFLEDNVRIHPFSTLTVAGSGSLRIGVNTMIGGYSLIFANEAISIGSFVSISSHVRIYSDTQDFSGESIIGCGVPDELRREVRSSVTIADHCGLCTGSALIPGAELSEGVVLAANSLLKTKTDPWNFYGGNPARLIKPRSKACLDLLKSG